ncbi:MAG: M20/M25/M40 family metallo-hydrolase [Verrucomicrobiales bacterium]
MQGEELQFLRTLLETRAPSGCEGPIQKKVAEFAKPFAESLESDVHGNLFVGINPDKKPRIMLASHCDQIGFIIKKIDKDGFAYIDLLGGPDETVLPGAQMIIETRNGPVEAILGKKATHMESSNEKNQVPTMNNVWIDVGAKNSDEAQKILAPGDSGVFAPRIMMLRNSRIASAALDNRAGLYVALQALKQCAEKKVDAGLFVASTVQEEIGMRGAITAATHLEPDLAIVVDVTNATDDPGGSSKTAVSCCLDNGPTISLGPNTNPVMHKLLVEVANKQNIPYQINPSASLEGNDAKEIQVAGKAIATATIGLPNRNMHTQVEICSLPDLDNAVRLIVGFVQAANGVDFRPFKL